jgi:polysaccharide export outer membrane protein
VPAVSTNAPSFTVQGKVSKPGTYAWTNGMTLTKAVATAGGLTRWAEPRVFVLRKAGGFPPGTKVYNHPFNTKGKDRATFNLREIERGNLKDPEIKAEDLIFVRPRMM